MSHHTGDKDEVGGLQYGNRPSVIVAKYCLFVRTAVIPPRIELFVGKSVAPNGSASQCPHSGNNIA